MDIEHTTQPSAGSYDTFLIFVYDTITALSWQGAWRTGTTGRHDGKGRGYMECMDDICTKSCPSRRGG